MADELKNIPESEYSNLSPRERFEELERIYNTLPPPANAEYIQLLQRHSDITKEMGKRLMANQDIIDLEKESDALGGEEEKARLRDQAQRIRDQRTNSEHRAALIKKLHNLLTTSSAPHTSAYYGLIEDAFSELYIDGVSPESPMANGHYNLSWRTFMADPTGIGGPFNPDLGRDLEQQAFSYTANSVLSHEFKLGDLLLELNEAMGRPSDPVMIKTGIAESKASPKHQHKIAFVRRWSNEFFDKFGEQAYKKVNY